MKPMALDDYRRQPRKDEIYGWNIGLTSTNHGRPRTPRPTGFGRRIPRPSDTASRSRTCASQTAPRLRALTECFRRRIQDHQRIRWARNWIKPLTTSTTALSQQHRRRAHHERELAKRRRTRRPLPLRLRHNGNVIKTLHATPSSASSWGRAPTITRLQDLSRIQPCTRITRIRIQFQWNQWKQHASAARDLAKSGQGYQDPVERQVRQ